jgi:hypothetical protein
MLKDIVRSCKPEPAPPPDSRDDTTPDEPPPPPDTPKKVIGIAVLATPLGKKVKTDADNATSVPPPCCAKTNELAVLIVTPTPAVTVVDPAPLQAINI